MGLVNHADVVAEELAQHFVFHRHVFFAANVVAKLGFHHREGRFNVATQVVMLQELLTVEPKVKVHLLPETPCFARLAIHLVRHEGRTAQAVDQGQVIVG
jgi:hypothetical protein